MRKTISVSILMILLLFTHNSCKRAQGSYPNGNPAYVIYNDKGRPVTYQEMLNSLLQTQVVLFGELHNDPISHWLELSLIRDFHNKKGSSLIVGAEMWERDNQLVLDEFLKGDFFDLRTYINNSVLWQNFENDYRPILEFIKKNDIEFIATNVPRRYASMVSSRGEQVLDSLSQEAKSYLPPLPFHINLDDKGYRYIAEVFKDMQQAPMSSSSLTNLVKAQALKDATMAYWITQSMKEGSFVFHFHGELHSALDSGIVYYLRHYKPNVKTKTISIIKKNDVMEFSSSESRADFNIVVPANMIVSYGN